MKDPAEHVMRYRAAAHTIDPLGVWRHGPHWYCTCDGWRFTARAMPYVVNGSNPNLAAAKRAFADHVAAVMAEESR